MSIADVVDALDLPAAALVGKRVSKQILSSHAASTAADKKKIESDIEEVRWIASLKPTTVAVSAFEDESRQYLEIAVVGVELRGAPARQRLVEIIHRAIPHPVMLIDSLGATTNLSGAAKRWSLASARDVVLEPPTYTTTVSLLEDHDERDGPLRKFLSLAARPFRDMFDLYDHWLDVICMAEAAKRTRVLVPLADPGQRLARRAGLADAARIDGVIASLRAEAQRASQMADRVELNLRIQNLRGELDAAIATI